MTADDPKGLVAGAPKGREGVADGVGPDPKERPPGNPEAEEALEEPTEGPPNLKLPGPPGPKPRALGGKPGFLRGARQIGQIALLDFL